MFWKKKRAEKQIPYEVLASKFIEKYPNGAVIECNERYPASFYEFIYYLTSNVRKDDITTYMVKQLIDKIIETGYYQLKGKGNVRYFYIDTISSKAVKIKFTEKYLNKDSILCAIFNWSSLQVHVSLNTETTPWDKYNILYYHHDIVELSQYKGFGRPSSYRTDSIEFYEEKITNGLAKQLLKESFFFHQLIMRAFEESDKNFIIHSPECSYIINAQGKSAIIMMNGGTMDIIIEDNNSYIITWDLIEKIEWRTGKLDIKKLRNPS